MKKHAAAVRSTVFLAVAVFAIGANAETLLWYRFDGDGATIVNKANPGTMDGTMKSINSWGSLGGLGDTASKFPTRGDAFPEGTRLIDPATDTVYNDTIKSLSFSGDPANSGTVRLLKADTTAALKEMMSCTCEVFFKLPSDSAAIETRRAKDILFPLVDWGSPDGNGQGWFLGLRKDNSTTGFYPFFRSKHNTTSSTPTQTDVQQSKVHISDANWHHMALRITADSSANKATVELLLDYTVVATGTLDSFYGFHYKNGGNFPFLVGADVWRQSPSNSGKRNCCFMGEIAEVRVSDTALATDKLLRPLPAGPVDADTLVYLPMGDCDWFGARNTSAYTNIWHGALNAAPTAACTPYWTNGTTSAAYPASAEDVAGASIRDGYFATDSFTDAKSTTFSRALVSGQYAGHVLRVPYEDAHLAEGSFTMEWFFKTDGQVPSGNGIKSYTFMYPTFAKIMINQADGKLKTRLVPQTGSYTDHDSANRVDDAKWHHYALVYDKKQGSFAIFLDYRLVDSGSVTLATGTTLRRFLFGAETESSQAFAGNLDDFRITRRALKAGEFLTTRAVVSSDVALFSTFEGDLSTGQDAVIAPAGSTSLAAAYEDVRRVIDLDGDGKKDYESTKALKLTESSLSYPHNALLESRDFTVEWFARYDKVDTGAMLMRFEMNANTIAWALYYPSSKLRMGVNVSSDGAWHGLARYDKDFATMTIADGKWHHWALVAQTNPDATTANTTFRLYRDYVQVGGDLVFDKNGAGGILALPSTGTMLSMGKITGLIDDLRITPKVLEPEKFMHKIPGGLMLIVR